MSATRIMVLICGLVFGGFGVMVWFATADVSEDAARLRTEGVLAQAAITEKFTRVTTSTSGIQSSNDYRSNQTQTVHYYVRYSFPVTGGAEHVSYNHVDKETWDRVQEGDRYTVKYVPADPDISTIIEDSYDDQVVIGQIAGSILVGLGSTLIILALGWPAIRRRWRRS